MDKAGVARIIDHSSRLAEHQEKLTTRFNEIADVIMEANHWAVLEKSIVLAGEHMGQAIEQRRYRASLMEEKTRDLIEEGTIRVSTEGSEVGQVNGLAVFGNGDVQFGKVNRITAIVSLGLGQFMNIERETRLSGKIHDKGFFILSGYLRGKYGYNKPLSLTASIGFEQSYTGVDGDSASSTELYALLSAISGIPIDQGIAVTGAVNQNGQVQAVGGATQKIEGFFDTCKAKGLTGNQWVIVPRDNLKHLAVSEEVTEAVRRKQFHIYGVSTVDEGIEVLTGVPAGDRQADGAFPEGTVHHAVEGRLEKMARSAREFCLPAFGAGTDMALDATP